MNLRLRELIVHCKKAKERVRFGGYSYFYGQMGAGKSSIARLIDYQVAEKGINREHRREWGVREACVAKPRANPSWSV